MLGWPTSAYTIVTLLAASKTVRACPGPRIAEVVKTRCCRPNSCVCTENFVCIDLAVKSANVDRDDCDAMLPVEAIDFTVLAGLKGKMRQLTAHPTAEWIAHKFQKHFPG